MYIIHPKMHTCANYDLLSSGDEIRPTIFHELNARRSLRSRIDRDSRHRGVLRQMEVRPAADRPEVGLAGADSTSVSQIRLHGREAHAPLAVVID